MNRSFVNGMKAAIPASLGVIPVGISIGLLGVEVGLTKMETSFMSAIVMAGSSQLMAITMLAQGSSFFTIIVGTFFVNLRHIIMSSSAMRRMRGGSIGKRLITASGLCDESFIVFSLSNDDTYPFLLGANITLYVSFVVSTIVGTLMTGFLPKIVVDSFGIALYGAFLGLLIPSVKNNFKLVLLVIGTAILNWLFQLVVSPSWAVIFSMILGAVLGTIFIDDISSHRKWQEENNDVDKEEMR